MADVLELETDSVFDPSQWIGVGRIYKDVPIEVSDACSAAFRMPVNLQATFPSPDLPVTNFWQSISPAMWRISKRCPARRAAGSALTCRTATSLQGYGLLILSLPTPSFANSKTTAPKNGSMVPSQFSTHPIKLHGCLCLHCLFIAKFTSFKKHKANGFAAEDGFGIISRDSTSRYSLGSRGIRCMTTRLMGSWIGPAFLTMNGCRAESLII